MSLTGRDWTHPPVHVWQVLRAIEYGEYLAVRMVAPPTARVVRRDGEWVIDGS